jgi:diguanylate cyclase (GGDEF)-like protein
MRALVEFRPRGPGVAKKVLFALTSIAAGVSVLFTLVFPTVQTRAGTSLTIGGCIIIVALAASLVLTTNPSLWVWAAYPFAAILVIAVLDLSSHDASVTAQIFFVFPVLYAGAQLQRHAAFAVCAAAVVADLAVTVVLQNHSLAFVDTSFVGAALVAATSLLVFAGERNDQLIAQLEQQAAVDPLTGLLTRRVLDSAAASALHGSGSDLGTALLLIDLDHFKLVNDEHGHPAGDAVLQQFAAILKRANRQSDVISRLGGDEIAVLLTSCPLDAALYRAEQILLEVRAHTFDVSSCTMATGPQSATDLSLSVSIGIAHLPTHAQDLRALYAAADTSLYRAKTSGRDRIGLPRPDDRLPAPTA